MWRRNRHHLILIISSSGNPSVDAVNTTTLTIGLLTVLPLMTRIRSWFAWLKMYGFINNVCYLWAIVKTYVLFMGHGETIGVHQQHLPPTTLLLTCFDTLFRDVYLLISIMLDFRYESVIELQWLALCLTVLISIRWLLYGDWEFIDLLINFDYPIQK